LPAALSPLITTQCAATASHAVCVHLISAIDVRRCSDEFELTAFFQQVQCGFDLRLLS
jgi:hypothetical protein